MASRTMLLANSLLRSRKPGLMMGVRRLSPQLDSFRADSTVATSALSGSPAAVETLPTTVIQSLNALGEPNLECLGLGCWYTPVGWIQRLLDYLHADFDLSWCTSIALCSLVLRLAMFPVAVLSQRNAAKMKAYMPILKGLQSQLTDARLRGDFLETLRIAQELQDFMKRYEIKPLGSMIPVCIQAPVFCSTFLAIRGLSNFPLESMTHGGVLWFTDLSESDPFYILPLITSISMLAAFETAMMTGTAPVQPLYKNLFRALPFVLMPITARFSSALLIYWTASNCIACVQTSFLNIPAIRKMTHIPSASDYKAPKGIVVSATNSGFIQELKKSFRNSKLLAEIKDRDRVDAQRFSQAGTGAVVPTFKENPRKQPL